MGKKKKELNFRSLGMGLSPGCAELFRAGGSKGVANPAFGIPNPLGVANPTFPFTAQWQDALSPRKEFAALTPFK